MNEYIAKLTIAKTFNISLEPTVMEITFMASSDVDAHEQVGNIRNRIDKETKSIVLAVKIERVYLRVKPFFLLTRTIK